MDKIDAAGLDIGYINRFVGHDAQLIQESNGRRRIVSERIPIGKGALSTIFRAYDLEKRQEIALKVPFAVTRKIEPEPVEPKESEEINLEERLGWVTQGMEQKEQPETTQKYYQGGFQRMVKRLNDETLIAKPRTTMEGGTSDTFGKMARSLREGEALQNINHPNILRAEGVIWANPPGVPAGERAPIPIIMLKLRDPKEWDSMDRKLYYEGKFSLKDAYHYFSQIAKGVDYLANLRPPIYHRDLKLANYLVNAISDKTEIIDLNISTAAVNADPNVIIGSPSYSNPEAILQGSEIDLRSETFSMAIGLFESITGDKPFKGNDVNETFIKISNIEYDFSPLEQFDSATKEKLEAFFKKAFAEEKKDRFQTATEMMKEFKKIAQQQSGNPIF